MLQPQSRLYATAMSSMLSYPSARLGRQYTAENTFVSLRVIDYTAT